MMKRYPAKLLALLLTCFFLNTALAQCPGQSTVQVIINPDNYPQEISWTLTAAGNQVASGTSAGATVCIPNGACTIFTIYDSANDGLCCGYGMGSYQVLLNGNEVGSGGDYDGSEQTILNCGPGTYCQNPIPVTAGAHTAPQANTYYMFHCTQTGVWEVSTCGLSECDTKLWIYGACNAQSTASTNVGTLFFDDNEGGCGDQARIEGFFEVGQDYIIRVGRNEAEVCNTPEIGFEINFLNEITGCTNPNACNYNPLATISGQCYFYPDPNCPAGPDLEIDQNAMINSLNIRTEAATNCMVVEGCMNGYGNRTVLAFDTHIRNIGETDYYIGNPNNNPGQFTFGNCHGHAHYEGYADYVLYQPDGTPIPIGQKNGFCVLDLECSGGGSGQYGCGNMGITAGCGDIYHNYLDCQWIDITTVDTGQYVLAVKVNWDQSPDALGRYELGYENNWAQVCIRLTMDVNGNRGFVILPNCAPIEDCTGTPYGNAEVDCNGECNGGAVRGDVDNNGSVQTADASDYIAGILNTSITPSPCRDISGDGMISVWDAGLANNCALNGPNNNNCLFPNTVINPNQEVKIGYISINPDEQYVDVQILNPDNRVVGYEFTVSGITIGDVESLVDAVEYPVTPAFTVNGNRIIGLSLVDSTIPKNLVPAPLVRIYYSSITDIQNICVSGVVHVLNTLYEPVVTSMEMQCLSVVGIKENTVSSFSLYPNPATSVVSVSLQTIAKEKQTVRIFDGAGKLVLTSAVEKGQQQAEINVKSLAPGTYKLQVGQETSSFIKQ